MKQRTLLTRRQFLGTVAAGAIGLSTAGIGYGLEARQAPPPFGPEHGVVAGAATLPAPATAPLLVVGNARAVPSFAGYLAEILRAEGLFAFQEAEVTRLTLTALQQYPLVLLSAGPLTADEAALLRRYVVEGGMLLALRPDPRLDEVFGVRHLGAVEARGSLQVVPGAPVVAGIETGRLQYHSPSDRLELAGAQELARSQTGAPLITLHHVGSGRAALWAFDLAHSIALQRQGNPEEADTERDDIPGVRAVDMFVDWIDVERIHVPQADEQQRLLANMLLELSSANVPLPRLWYFPGGTPSVLVTTGDAHGSTANYVEEVLARVEQRGGTMSVYYTPPPASTLGRMTRKARWWAADVPVMGVLLERDQPLPTPGHLAAWRERGHEFGMHPYVEEGLAYGYNAYWNEFLKFGYGPVPPTVRTHRILWHGWVENARVQAQYGLRMNLDHYHIGSTVRTADGAWRSGYLGGTGLPMRFVDQDGTLLNVFQQATHLVDEHMMNVFDTGYDQGLDGSMAASLSRHQIAESVGRYPSALGVQCHIDPFLLGGEKAANVGQWFEETLDFATDLGVATLSAERWLAFVEARMAARVEQVQWQAATGRWQAILDLPPQPAGPLELMLPQQHNGAELSSIRLNGETHPWHRRRLAGREYVSFYVPHGRTSIEAGYSLSAL
ncbi:hypothetical protein [Candidatus Chloroploca asiatica]|uniref:hypothetical protein n=1 Tax=Candidatus Chloroploca asiatica TaxID=1506545 RepID=UPI001C0F1B4D|nr:hypothetical protein [Candidatus Chloroploca asiatica]